LQGGGGSLGGAGAGVRGAAAALASPAVLAGPTGQQQPDEALAALGAHEGDHGRDPAVVASLGEAAAAAAGAVAGRTMAMARERLKCPRGGDEDGGGLKKKASVY
jgi:hypothetical protein